MATQSCAKSSAHKHFCMVIRKIFTKSPYNREPSILLFSIFVWSYARCLPNRHTIASRASCFSAFLCGHTQDVYQIAIQSRAEHLAFHHFCMVIRKMFTKSPYNREPSIMLFSIFVWSYARYLPNHHTNRASPMKIGLWLCGHFA